MAIANSVCFRLLLCTNKINTVREESTIEGIAGGLSPKHWIWKRGAPPQMPSNISVCYFSSMCLLQ